MKQGKPVSLPVSGKPTVRKAVGDAGKGTRKKQKPACNGLDTGLDVTGRESEQTSAIGALSREIFRTFEGRKANERESQLHVCTFRT